MLAAIDHGTGLRESTLRTSRTKLMAVPEVDPSGRDSRRRNAEANLRWLPGWRAPVRRFWVQGETGTGKEVIARQIHQMSPRARQPLRIVNCSAIPETLSESVLFGHSRGAFTGADRRVRGVFQQADGGTIFLDEVAELSSAAQAALLRVLGKRGRCSQ